jgi:hypothetical protein
VRAPLYLLLLPILLSGCRSNSELVEAELRDKEAKLAELQHELGRRDCDIRALQSEVDRLQRYPAGHPGEAAIPCGVRRIVLGRMTSGHDAEPECAGDEGILVVVEPHDCDNQSVKAPGNLHIEAFEINPQGLKSPLSAWDVPPRELRKHWDTPVFGQPSYRVPLRWQVWPREERLRIVALFTTTDGQRFEADRDITVRLPGTPVRAQPLKTAPRPDEILPPPRPVPDEGGGPQLAPPTPPLDPAVFRPRSTPDRGVGLQAPVRQRPEP